MRVIAGNVMRLLVLAALTGMALGSGQARAQGTQPVVSPPIDIFVGPGEQGVYGVSAVFDPPHSRFLVAWTDAGLGRESVDLYGQLVNADGTLFGSRIPIEVNESQAIYPAAAFDTVNQRFLVVWMDGRNGDSNIYGRLVNADGSLYGSDFAISPIPPEYHRAGGPKIQFDSVNVRFLVIWSGPSAGLPSNIYGQFVKPDGSLDGSLIQFTDFGTDYYMGWQDTQFDPTHERFLVTWVNQYDGHIYGQLVSAGGALYGPEITIGSYGVGWSYTGSLGFDPVQSRFLQAWDGTTGGVVGQLISADGSLYGSEFEILTQTAYFPSVVFDSKYNKTLVLARTESPHPSVFAGQFLNPDGSLYGSEFEVAAYAESGTGPIAASGSAQAGSLVAYVGSYYDIFGKLVELAPAAVGGIAEYPQVGPPAASTTGGASAPNAVALALGAAGGALLLTVGGSYARRRRLT
jgi:hypothetical protein